MAALHKVGPRAEYRVASTRATVLARGPRRNQRALKPYCRATPGENGQPAPGGAPWTVLSKFLASSPNGTQPARAPVTSPATSNPAPLVPSPAAQQAAPPAPVATASGLPVPRQGALARDPKEGAKLVKVKFVLKFRTDYGQAVRIIGSHPRLGNWNIQNAPVMTWNAGDLWTVMLDLPSGGVYEYKYVLVEYNTTTAQAWQQGSNAVLAIAVNENSVEVQDTWTNEPGAETKGDSLGTLTRESRLQKWAAEMMLYRGEARRMQLELYQAQAEVATLKNETARLRMEVALAQRATMEAESRNSELVEANMVLRAQLAQSQLAMKATLEEAIKLLSSDLLDDEEEMPVPMPPVVVPPAAVAAEAAAIAAAGSAKAAAAAQPQQRGAKVPFQAVVMAADASVPPPAAPSSPLPASWGPSAAFSSSEPDVPPPAAAPKKRGAAASSAEVAAASEATVAEPASAGAKVTLPALASGTAPPASSADANTRRGRLVAKSPRGSSTRKI